MKRQRKIERWREGERQNQRVTKRGSYIGLFFHATVTVYL